MINSEELLFVVDENNNPLTPLPRHIVHSGGHWHRVIHVWTIDGNGNLLCNKRSINKDQSPGNWAAGVGGHILAGEDPVHTAVSEFYEELGIKISENDLQFYKICKNVNNKEFQYVYYILWDGSIDELKLEKEEIDEVRWFDIHDVEDNISDKKITNWSKAPIYFHEIIPKLLSIKN
ncbi:MAG: NUDIX domain-containing protein [Patescibacteria group bacterium]